jgi:hypothetical protein
MFPLRRGTQGTAQGTPRGGRCRRTRLWADEIGKFRLVNVAARPACAPCFPSGTGNGPDAGPTDGRMPTCARVHCIRREGADK